LLGYLASPKALDIEESEEEEHSND
jgi:hypothetical protein